MKRFNTLWILVGVLAVLLCILANLLVRFLSPAKPTATLAPVMTATAGPTWVETPIVPTVMPVPQPSGGPIITPASPEPEPWPTSTPTVTPEAQPSDSPTQSPTPLPASPTWTSAPTATPVTITDWQGEYFDNVSLQSPPKVVRNDRIVDFSLPKGTAPASNMPSENWSARWTRSLDLTEGNYRFRVVVDDGARLWVAGRFLIDAWADGGPREYLADLYLKGNTPIKLEYYNHLGDARISLNWEKIDKFLGWQGSYYAAPDLSGLPVFQRDDEHINFDWGTDSPRPDLPVDNFSARWTRRLNFAQAGVYRFQAASDDGVRVWVGGKLVIDAWRDGQRTYEGQIQLAAGETGVSVEYYEYTGHASIKLSWDLVSSLTATPAQTSTAVAPTVTPIPPTVTLAPPTVTSIPLTVPPVPPTVTPIPPTQTPLSPTSTPLPPTLPPSQPTATPIPPTLTATPPSTLPPGVEPVITLDPASGRIGQPFTILGKQWPPNTTVNLSLAQPDAQARQGGPVGQVVTDEKGNFTAPFVVPAGEGWEGKQSARVVAATYGRTMAGAVYKLLPELKKLDFGPIPAGQDRFALAEQTYLVLTSAEEWEARFGPEPPPAQPPVDWQREIVIGAFLGPQATGAEIAVTNIVLRDTTISTWLSIPVKGDVRARQDGREIARVLVRVPREQLQTAPITTPADLTFAFLDAIGRLLAQGPAGAIPSVSAQASAAAAVEQQLAAPPPGATREAAALAVTQVTEPLVEVLPAAVEPAAKVEPSATAESADMAELMVTVEPAAKAKPSTGNVVTGVLIAAGVMAVAGMGLYFARRRGG